VALPFDDLARELGARAGRRLERFLAGRPAAPAPRSGLAPLPADAAIGPRQLAALIDHTLLGPGAGPAEVERICGEARAHGFAGVCVRSEHVAQVARLLQGSPVLPVAVVDFPRGEGPVRQRVAEARRAVVDGAREIDVVVPLPALLAFDLAAVALDLEAVVLASDRAAVKVILETCRLTSGQKVAAAALAAAAGAAFVKTSTGHGSGGATEEDVRLLRATVGAGVGVKASGGIRSAADALRMVRAGASRIGCSASVAIVAGASG